MNIGTTAATVMTVTGPRPAEALGVTDAHNHLWIAPPGSRALENAAAADPGTALAPGLPALTDAGAIARELAAYRAAGGGAVVDCQPGRAGRDAAMLRRLSEQSGVAVVACTGFHLRRYYPPGEPPWSWSADAAAAHFIRELRIGMEEGSGGSPVRSQAATNRPQSAIRAGFVKAACEATLAASPRPLLEAAARAAAETRAAVELHTERGAAAEELPAFFAGLDVPPGRLVICHVDKRPDFGLHRELAAAGALLEYDTFYRPKYDPERGVWPLLERMVDAGLAGSVALATDMAEAALWTSMGGGPGLPGFLTVIGARLERMGVPDAARAALLGGNIACRLAVAGAGA